MLSKINNKSRFCGLFYILFKFYFIYSLAISTGSESPMAWPVKLSQAAMYDLRNASWVSNRSGLAARTVSISDTVSHGCM